MPPAPLSLDAHVPLSLTAEGSSPFLVTTPARSQDRRWGLSIALVSMVFFALLVPFATTPLAAMPGFMGIYQSALVVVQLLVAVLFFSKHHVLRLPSLHYLASAYLFSALMAIAHALTFPGLFRPTGLLQATPQTTAWLYMFWHAGFPVLLMAYAASKGRPPVVVNGLRRWHTPAINIGLVVLAVVFFTVLATAGSDWLPAIMVGNQQYFPIMKPVVTTVCVLNALALFVLWRTRPYNAMDIWLMVVCITWVFDIALSAVLNAARFDVGFYFGRLYGLVAAVLILGVLLFESTKMYGELAKAHARDIEVNREIKRLYEKAQELDKIKIRFFANMSHEIRTPMNAILGITYLLKRSNPTPEQLERFDKIAMASRHLLSIINDILDFSKIESGVMQLEENTFPISSVLDHTRSLIEDSAHAKGLVISVDYDDCPHWLVGDQTRLRQAMLNLASNAVKFTDHGRIELKCSLQEKGSDFAVIRFEVVDTGIGIAPEVIPELFQAFKQADASTTRKYGGTGLGLAITQKLATLMQGTVGVDSKVGQGSRFWFTARLKVGAQMTDRTANNAEQELIDYHSGTRVLLVEDDAINQEIARVLLSEAGMQVSIANNGQEAVDQARSQAFDLILMDIQMPVMDGLEATKAIRQLPDRQEVPILALTANIFEEDRRRSREAGMVDLIGKPVDPMELFATILKWLPQTANVHIPVLQKPQEPLASAQNPKLQVRLQGIEGLDLDLGLSRLRGDVNKFWALLREFVRFHGEDMPEIRKALQRQQMTEANRLVHTLKGTAATIGLTRLQSDAQRLETALQAGILEQDALMASIAAQQLVLAQTVNSIASEMREPDTAPDPVKAREVLQQLGIALKTGDFHANQLFSENLPVLRASLPPMTFHELEAAVDSYDFEKAVMVLEKMAPMV